jgi:hypothetical protein
MGTEKKSISAKQGQFRKKALFMGKSGKIQGKM